MTEAKEGVQVTEAKNGVQVTADEIPQWSDDAVAEAFRAEIRARMEAHNAAYRASAAAELEQVLRDHPEKRGQPGYDVRDSGSWEVYQASEIRIDRNVVTIVLPSWFGPTIEFVHLFDNTTVAWSRPRIGAMIVDGAPRVTIEVILVATWTDEMDAEWRRAGNDKKRLLVELPEEDVRAFADACARPHAACNCADYPADERPCTFCSGMPLSAEVLLRMRTRLELALALEPLP